MQQDIEQPRAELEDLNSSSSDQHVPQQEIRQLSVKTCQSLNPNKTFYYDTTFSVCIEGGYDISQIDKLPISDQLKQLFQTIQRYYPILSKLKIEQKAFIPDYIPICGSPDPFLKMPRPDGKPQQLGLYLLDEPNKLTFEQYDAEMKILSNIQIECKSRIRKSCLSEQQKEQIKMEAKEEGNIKKNQQKQIVQFNSKMEKEPQRYLFKTQQNLDCYIDPELKDLFKQIQHYTPVVQVLKGKHKPFIPEMIPIVGIPDSFLKIPRPDKEQEMLGLKFLDELILFPLLSNKQVECKSRIRKSCLSEQQKEQIKMEEKEEGNIKKNQQKQIEQFNSEMEKEPSSDCF